MSYLKIINQNYVDVGVANDDMSTAPSSGFYNVVQTIGGVWYRVFMNIGPSAITALMFAKSSDRINWSQPTVLAAASQSVQAFSIWYDRWSNISAGLIHVAWHEGATDDIHYRTIDTENSDTLSTDTTMFDGASTAAAGSLSITRALGGNVYVWGMIDAGAEGGFFRLPNANVPSGAWDAARTSPEALAATDRMLLVPGFAADNQDIMGIFYDGSSTELSRYVYDDSANTWAESSIDTDCTFPVVSTTTSWQHYSAAVDLTNSQIILVMWNAVDTASADLRCWTVTESAITAKTDVVANGTDDQGLAAIGIDTTTGYWYVWYAGKSDGSETFLTNVNIYMKYSTDSGSTWSAEVKVSQGTYTQDIRLMCTSMRFVQPWGVYRMDRTSGSTFGNVGYFTTPYRASGL